jgi:hypothetical protein
MEVDVSDLKFGEAKSLIHLRGETMIKGNVLSSSLG